MISLYLLLLLAVGSLIGAAAGYLGSFMVLKRMSLVGDALTHVALPGMAIAIAIHIHPLIGAFIALALAVIVIWHLEQTSSVYPDALFGILFTASLAIGILITPEPDLLEALFGTIEHLTVWEGVAAALLSVSIIFATKRISQRLTLGIISSDLARSLNVPLKSTSLIYYLLVGTVVALGIRFIGTLLMGALVIIPAASAKNIAPSLRSYHAWSILFGVTSALTGIFLSTLLHTSPGPIVVLSSAFIFTSTYLAKSLLSK